MFANYRIRFSITNYGFYNSFGFGNNSIYHDSGSEQADTTGIPNYYVINTNAFSYHVVRFHQYWNDVKYNGLPYYSESLKYVNGYFYIPRWKYLYKTGNYFNLIASYNNSNFGYFSISSLFYVLTVSGVQRLK